MSTMDYHTISIMTSPREQTIASRGTTSTSADTSVSPCTTDPSDVPSHEPLLFFVACPPSPNFHPRCCTSTPREELGKALVDLDLAGENQASQLKSPVDVE